MSDNHPPKAVKGGEVYFFHGSEEYLLKNAVADVKRMVLAVASDPTTAWTVYDMSESSVGALMTDVRTVSFFGGVRGVLAVNPEKMEEDDQAKLIGYADDPSPDVVLLVAAGKIDGRLKFWKDFSAKTRAVKFDPGEKERKLLVSQKLKESGIKFEPAAAALMTEMFENKISFLDSELEKLGTYLGEQKSASVSDISACVNAAATDSVFKLVDSIAQKKGGRSLEALKSLMDNGEKPVAIMGMIARQFRILLLIRTFKTQNMPANEIAKRCKVNPYFFQGYLDQAAKLSTEAIKKNIVSLSRADLRLKSAGLNEWHHMEQEILHLTR